MRRAPFSNIFLILAFLLNTIGPIPIASADVFDLPTPGVMVNLSPTFNPSVLRGIKVDPNDPFRFEFILDRGDALPTRGHVPPAQRGYVSPSSLPSNNALNTQAPQGNHLNNDQELREQSTRLIKYFLASLTVPENDLWVNLSPYEKNRIVPQAFGQTEMGRDLLAEDYMLKQITFWAFVKVSNQQGSLFQRSCWAY